MSDDNTTLAAKASLNNEEVDEATRTRIGALLEEITQLEATAADVDNQRNELKIKAQETSSSIADKYQELLSVMPANPLGNMTLGMSQSE